MSIGLPRGEPALPRRAARRARCGALVKLALIGVGLIGGSFARAALSAGAVTSVAGIRCGCGGAVRGAPPRRHHLGRRLRGGGGAAGRPGDARRSGRRDGWRDEGDRASLARRRDRDRCRQHEGAASSRRPARNSARTSRASCRAIRSRGGSGPGSSRRNRACSRASSSSRRPSPRPTPPRRSASRGLWQRIGARVERMDAQEHDRVFAAVSHLPHLLAFALVAQIAREDGCGPQARQGRRGISRLHAHRGIESAHVARRLHRESRGAGR